MQVCVLILGLVDCSGKTMRIVNKVQLSIDKIDVIDVGGCPVKLYSLGEEWPQFVLWIIGCQKLLRLLETFLHTVNNSGFLL